MIYPLFLQYINVCMYVWSCLLKKGGRLDVKSGENEESCMIGCIGKLQ